MLNQQILQYPPAKIILIVLILLEIAVISYSYSVNFDDYISFIVIILAIIIAYFTYHYLKFKIREVRGYQAIVTASKPDQIGDLTRTEVDKLIETPQFKKFQKERQTYVRKEHGTLDPEDVDNEREEQKSEQTEAVIEDLMKLEEDIFGNDSF